MSSKRQNPSLLLGRTPQQSSSSSASSFWTKASRVSLVVNIVCSPLSVLVAFLTPHTIPLPTNLPLPQEKGVQIGELNVVGNTGQIDIGNVKGAQVEAPAFTSDFLDDENWTRYKELQKNRNVISYRKIGRRASPALMLTKEKFPQHAEVIIKFVPLRKAINFHFRVADSFDLRFGDGGNSEAALGPFSPDDPNWSAIDLTNPSCERKDRFCLPCPVATNKVVNLRIVIDSPPNYRDGKTVIFYSDYYCEDGRHVDPQDSSYVPPLWKFQVPSSVNKPTNYGVGLDDPSGKDKPQIELLQISITPHE